MKTQTDYTDPRNTPLAEAAVADYVKQNMDSAIQRMQRIGVDPFGFGERVRRTFLTWPEWDSFAWPTKYPSAHITTRADVSIKQYGLDLAPPRIAPWEIIQGK
jgi:hypothetical protein